MPSETCVETIHSKPWPHIRAEIYRERQHNGIVWRAKVYSKAYPDLATTTFHETKERAVAHANVCLGN